MNVIVMSVGVGRVGVCILCTYVSEERGDGEGTGSEALSLLSYTLKYISLADVGINCLLVGLRQPMHLSTFVSEEWGDGEGPGSEALSLLSYTLQCISLAGFCITACL